MAKTQYFTVQDPIVRRSLEDLDQASHSHAPRTSVPKDTDGTVGDIVPVTVNSIFYLYVKFTDGWKKFIAV